MAVQMGMEFSISPTEVHIQDSGPRANRMVKEFIAILTDVFMKEVS